MNATILGFASRKPINITSEQQNQHTHGRKCLCLGCRRNRAILEDLRQRPLPTSSDPLVKLYEESLMKGLENWGDNPHGSMFDVISTQLIRDGIVKV